MGKWGWSIWDGYQETEFVMTQDGAGFPTAEAARENANREWNFTREQAELAPEQLTWDQVNRVARTSYPAWVYGEPKSTKQDTVEVVIRYFRFEN